MSATSHFGLLMRLGWWGWSYLLAWTSALALWLRFGLDGQTIKRTYYAAHSLWRDGDVASECAYNSCASGVNAAMAKQDLNGARIGAAFQQVGGKRVSEHMWGDAFGDAGQLDGVAAKLLDGSRLEMGPCLGAGKQPIDRALHFIISAQQDEGAIAEHGVAILGSFTVLDVDQHALGVDVLGFEGNGFGDAQARAVAEHHYGTVLQDADMAEEGQHFFLAQYDGQLFRNFHASELLLGPRHIQRLRYRGTVPRRGNR